MTCAICRTECRDVVHRFHVGSADRPTAEWAVTAPLYYASTKDFRGAVAGFCGVAHSMQWHQRRVA